MAKNIEKFVVTVAMPKGLKAKDLVNFIGDAITNHIATFAPASSNALDIEGNVVPSTPSVYNALPFKVTRQLTGRRFIAKSTAKRDKVVKLARRHAKR